MQQERKLNVVAFLGAGFSAPMGIPTMTQFRDHIRDNQLLSGDDLDDLDGILNTCDPLAAMIGASSHNLEDVASLLAMLDRVAGREVMPRTTMIPSDALQLLNRAIVRIAHPDIVVNEGSPAANLLAQNSAANLSVITTNYDVTIELAARATGLLIRPTHELSKAIDKLIHVDNVIYGYSAEAVDLFKLHGSVNWLLSDQRVQVIGAADRRENGFVLRDPPCPMRDNEHCVLVPPAILKTDTRLDGSGAKDILDEQWVGAARALRYADSIWFFGYSFPASDSYMRYFLAASIRDNVKLRQIAIVNPDKGALDRARELFYLPTHRDVLSTYKVECEDIDLGMLKRGEQPPFPRPEKIQQRIEEREAAARIREGGA